MAHPTITTETVEKLAKLMCIGLKKEELNIVAGQLNTVLNAAEVLNELDTANVEPAFQTHGQQNVLAADIAEPGIDMKNYKNTKNFDGHYFVVKGVQ